jgi:hypothetical protein
MNTKLENFMLKTIRFIALLVVVATLGNDASNIFIYWVNSWVSFVAIET